MKVFVASMRVHVWDGKLCWYVHLEPADRHKRQRMKFISLISAMIKVPAVPRRGPLKTRPNKSGIYIPRDGHLHSAFWGAVKDAISGKSRNCPQGSDRTEKNENFRTHMSSFLGVLHH